MGSDIVNNNNSSLKLLYDRDDLDEGGFRAI